MSFPNLANCNTCGGTVTSCSCSKTSQTTTPIQSLPKPTTPCNFDGIPEQYYSTDQVLWSGADNDNLGIKNGDPLTKVLNIIMQNL